MSTVVMSGAVLASFLAGVVALFAPCCISVMLPAYFASSFASKRALVGMTFVFALGVGLIILPIALGAAAIGAVIVSHHLAVYLAGGLLMLGLGLYVLVGGELAIPMPGMPQAQGRGPLAVLTLGAFSGVASSCCAPVLFGLVTLAGASASLGSGLLLGVAYIFGMVFPLFAIALLWERFNWSQSRLLRGRHFTFGVLGWRVSLHSTALASAAILIAMGLVVIGIAFNGAAMSASGWQLTLSGAVQHYTHLLEVWLRSVPGWLTSIVILVLILTLVGVALHQLLDRGEPDEPESHGDQAASRTADEIRAHVSAAER